MGSTGRNCKRWWDHQDRDCKNNEKMRFLVVADEDFRNSMRIPQEFGSCLRKIISNTIKLNAPNGCKYDIEVCREKGEIVLRFGWDVFADAHNLEQNDYLVFKFCGSSSFKVQIYSSCGGSQKITSYVNPDPEILEDVPPRTTSDHHVPNGNDIPHPGHVQTPACFEYFTSGGSRLTKAQDKKVLEIARTIMSEIPLYVAVMNKSNGYLNSSSIRIPSILMEDVREEIFQATVKLEAPDGNVYGISATQQGNDEIILHSGWDSFLVAHHIQERDLMIFRHKGNSRLEVFILDSSGHQKTSSWFGMGDGANTQEMCDDSVEIVKPPHKAVGITETPDDLQSALDRRVDQSALSFNNSEGPSQPLYMISKKLTCRTTQEMVQQKVQAIRSRFPIYVAVLTRISTGQKYIMRFSREYARRCLPSSTQGLTLELEGCQSKEWQTVLHVQGGHSKSSNDVMIYHGWAAFASDNRLLLGDICLFELVSVMTRLKMRVHIIRMLGGCMYICSWNHPKGIQ